MAERESQKLKDQPVRNKEKRLVAGVHFIVKGMTLKKEFEQHEHIPFIIVDDKHAEDEKVGIKTC